ncbi:AtpZ/AtpI family protein [Albimonas sp. CAU 1670]|uniref:AtpZ/AtpI family protein n=1 Tax=Albimonas sp. CAU 1670 TaxID=3032599 RepID=UPI0023DAA351|nr:AtpZ/AtpI family protein [Albimonas sp. CAU 1670]MDF2235459.1 AtpZ/AtpI family protein [Albimonas sp. CAU 1670]
MTAPDAPPPGSGTPPPAAAPSRAPATTPPGAAVPRPTAPDPCDPVADAAQRAGRREAAGREDPEPSLGRRFGQIGVLGWMIAGPAVGGAALGAWLDGLMGSGITLAAALTMLGAGLGLWFALNWMHQQ